MKILYSSPAIRTAIRDLFSDTTKPCGAYVAFIGAGAPDYLPKDLSNFELICWLKPGATDPTALRTLARRKARLLHADGLHMKVYWSSVGAVVTSANLSDNGLGDGRLREMGVQLPPNVLDIKQIRSMVSANEITESALIEYERRNTAYIARNAGNTMFGNGTGRSRRRVPSFVDWYESYGRTPWRWLGYSEDYDEIGEQSRAKLKQTGQTTYEEHITGDNNTLRQGEWVLCVDLCDVNATGWLYPEWVVKLTPVDDGWSDTDPLEAVQRHEARCYGSPPFAADRRFKSVLWESMKEIGLTTESEMKKESKNGEMPDYLITAIYNR